MKKVFSRTTARAAAIVLVCTILAGFFSACWDSYELDALFIATGLCLDASETEGAVSFSVQVGNISKTVSGQGGQSPEKSYKMLDASDRTVLAALEQIRRKSNRELFLHHIQVIVVGMDLAKQGISDELDFFLRDREMRLETWLVLAEGKASELVSEEFIQGQVPTLTLANMIHYYTHVSPHLGVNILDFVSKHITDSYSPVIPIMQTASNVDSPTMDFAGFGVFKEGKLVGTLNIDESDGYMWAEFGFSEAVLDVFMDEGTAALRLVMEQGRPKTILNPDGSVSVQVNVKASLIIGELKGFEGLKETQIGELVEKGAAEEIKRKINIAFDKSQELEADIFGIGEDIHEKHPKEWEKMKNSWIEMYKKIEPELDVEIVIEGIGKTSGILEKGSKN